MLKLIPQESPSGKASRQQKTPKTLNIPKLQQKMGEEQKVESNIIKGVYLNLIRFLKKGEAFTLDEIGLMIHSLQRAILSLERKRIQLLHIKRRQQKKKKK